MIRFNNDYNHGAHPRILEAFARTNDQAFGGYGLDQACEEAAGLIRAQLGEAGANAHVHFLVGGTQANVTVIGHLLRPWESALCADTGHINVHETGALEACGHKAETMPNADGKITAGQIAAAARENAESPVPEHVTTPRLVYISFTTEVGTLYSLAELEAISAACREAGLLLFVDGARMGYGLGAQGNDVTLADFTRLCDVFTIGGTKCGAAFGEAVVFCTPGLDEHFRSSIKQHGGMLAKGWLLGLQFAELFRDGLYFDICRHADEQAMRIREAFSQAGIPAHVDSPSNQQFVVLTQAQCDELAKRFVFEPEGTTPDGRPIVRFCTSWATRPEEVDELVAAIAAL